MSSLGYDQSQFKLTPERLKLALDKIKLKLSGRVQAAYIFGSTASNTFNYESDIDLILIVEKSDTPYVQRPFAFIDLFDIYPKIDILVYTPEEFQAQLADSSVGFWKDVRESLVQIV
jgi:predicted nucleotidyltransferase